MRRRILVLVAILAITLTVSQAYAKYCYVENWTTGHAWDYPYTNANWDCGVINSYCQFYEWCNDDCWEYEGSIYCDPDPGPDYMNADWITYGPSGIPGTPGAGGGGGGSCTWDFDCQCPQGSMCGWAIGFCTAGQCDLSWC